MTKHMFMYFVVIILVGIAGWFFIQKTRDVSNKSDDSGLASLVATEEPSPSPEENSSDSGGKMTKLSNGLQLQDIVVGYGKEAREGDIVATHYSGTLADGTKFDSSYDRGQPFSFILGGGMVIKGWDLGVVGMKIGGKRKLIIPPELAYGDRNIGNGLIPPNSTLYFEIELVAVETPKQK